MKNLICSLAAVVAVSASAIPQLTDVNVVESGSHVVTISYKVANEPAVVTVDIQTNSAVDASGTWASIGGENVSPALSGDVSKMVMNGENVYTAFWRPGKSWPGHLFENGTAKAVLTAWPTNAPPLFMAVDLREGVSSRVAYYADKSYVPGGITNDIYKTTSMLFRKIPAAGIKWKMGTVDGAAGIYHRSGGDCAEDEHNVTLTEDYYMAVYPTTFGQHAMVAARAKDFSLSYSCWGGTTSTIYDEVEDCALNRCSYTTLRGSQTKYNWPKDGHSVMPNGFLGVLRSMTGIEVDLPTEAQWEFAARAGTSTQTYFGKTTTAKWQINTPYLDDYAWCDKNCDGAKKMPVGRLLPNAFDLYDVIGNTYEACLDVVAQYSLDDQVNPKGPEADYSSAMTRVVRGGSVRKDYAYYLTSSFRAAYPPYAKDENDNDLGSYPYYGFRACAPAAAVAR